MYDSADTAIFGESTHTHISPPDDDSSAAVTLELLARRPEWHDQAACRTAPPDITWFPENGQDQTRAKAVCAACPALEACRAWAEQQGAYLAGIWGGLNYKDRTVRRRRRGRAA
jgi:WhiB family redox-sensing transcriptional regulator